MGQLTQAECAFRADIYSESWTFVVGMSIFGYGVGIGSYLMYYLLHRCHQMVAGAHKAPGYMLVVGCN
jgi:hypothetical protein